ncbi:hypothetical protein ElyMa_002737200 [Elysia marginata]|uniref:Uncharacterized protein n=1 Tax=Elysia marginata TaxID=1093978 RepID=A0AAV4HFZ7_9GAST|nr:hypothetical protein ElyMa_002737200 [Elysia marginata]
MVKLLIPALTNYDMVWYGIGIWLKETAFYQVLRVRIGDTGSLGQDISVYHHLVNKLSRCTHFEQITRHCFGSKQTKLSLKFQTQNFMIEREMTMGYFQLNGAKTWSINN